MQPIRLEAGYVNLKASWLNLNSWLYSRDRVMQSRLRLCMFYITDTRLHLLLPTNSNTRLICSILLPSTTLDYKLILLHFNGVSIYHECCNSPLRYHEHLSLIKGISRPTSQSAQSIIKHKWFLYNLSKLVLVRFKFSRLTLLLGLLKFVET